MAAEHPAAYTFTNYRYEGEPRLYDSELRGPSGREVVGRGDTLLAAITDAERQYGDAPGLHAAVVAERRRHI